jgi:hypothetical protein
MSSELLSASLRQEVNVNGHVHSGLIEGSLAGRLRNVRWQTICNAGFGEASATVLGRDGYGSMTAEEAAYILDHWRFAVLRIFMQGASAYVGRVWRIELGPLIDNTDGGWERTVEIRCRGLAYDWTLRPALMPGRFTDEGATATVADLIDEAMIDQPGILARPPENLALATINVGQISPSPGAYWLDTIINALHQGDALGIEWTLLIYEPDKGPALVPRGQGVAAWRLPANAQPGVVWDGAEYVAEHWVNYTDATNSAQSTVPITDEAAIARHHGVIAGRSTNIAGAGLDGAEQASRTYLQLHAEPVSAVGPLVVRPNGAPFARVPDGDGGLRPGWEVRAGELIDLEGVLPRAPHRRHLHRHTVESTEYDDETGTLTITLDERRIDSRTWERPEEIARLQSALAPSRPRGTFPTFELKASSLVPQVPTVVPDMGDDGLMLFSLPQPSLAKVHFEATITGTATAVPGESGRYSIGVDIDIDDWSEDESERLAVAHPVDAVNRTLVLVGMYQTWLPAGEHTIRLWYERHPDSTDGGTLSFARVWCEA